MDGNCLLDSGSERSLISTNVEDELELPGLMNAMTVKGLNGLYVRIANFHRVLFCLTSTAGFCKNETPSLQLIQMRPGPVQIHALIGHDAYFQVLG
ncbi:hypothetical protein T11_10085 [Trichinella zimbabwensis]|uniref:Peptidase A2 domain-containing protein n=1 Tax=Trichinella zimbabwensis TaxID=268475 RepID=A0A0V1GKW8_9BILA|nr:hypothetical protein T11_10085 [Trichinella zimbabwensis]